MPQMKSLRNFRLATLTGTVVQVKANVPFYVPQHAVEDAMKAGCVPVDENDLEFAEAQINSRVEFSGGLRASLIYLAIDTVVSENKPKNFDAGNMPKLDVIADRVGFQVSPAELRELFQQHMSNKADGKEYDVHPKAALITQVMSATTKAELLELCVEQGIPEDKAKGENMAGMRKLLLTKLNGIAQE